MISILLVEDDRELAKLICNHLEKYDITHVATANEALVVLEESKMFSLVILDLTLQDIDGLKLCRLIKKKQDIDIIISSARNSIEDKLEGLSRGCANDYIVKPYDPRELEARIIQLVSHRQNINLTSKFRIDFKGFSVYKEEQKIPFTEAEYEIFKLLFLNQNRYFSRADIANAISSHGFDSMLESISVLLSKVRKKIDNSNGESYIKNQRGIGYSFYEKK